MTWFKVDDTFYRHPKTAPLSFAAKGVWLHAGTWCADQLTDGFVPTRMLRAWAVPDDAVAELVECECWAKVDGGYQFHDWLDYQPSREKVLADREANAARQAAWRDKKHKPNGVSNALRNAVSNGVTDAPVTPAPVPVPDPVPQENSLTRARVREEQETDQQIGFDLAFNVSGKHWMGYERTCTLIGAKPAAERAVVLKAMLADPWVQANRLFCNPDHILRKWPVYVEGVPAMKLVAVTAADPKKAEAAARAAELKAKGLKLKQELAKLTGDDVDVLAKRFELENQLRETKDLYERACRNAG